MWATRVIAYCACAYVISVSVRAPGQLALSIDRDLSITNSWTIYVASPASLAVYFARAVTSCLLLIIASEVSFLVCSMARIFAIYIFQVDRHSVNVLNVSTCI